MVGPGSAENMHEAGRPTYFEDGLQEPGLEQQLTAWKTAQNERTQQLGHVAFVAPIGYNPRNPGNTFQTREAANPDGTWDF